MLLFVMIVIFWNPQFFMIKDPNLVKYSNKVVRSAQRLSLLEQRILYSAIAKSPADHQITCEDVFLFTSRGASTFRRGCVKRYVSATEGRCYQPNAPFYHLIPERQRKGHDVGVSLVPICWL